MTRIVAISSVLVAGACTTAMNWRFSFQLGASVWDSYTWAIFSVALDITKWLMLPFAAIAWTNYKLRATAAFVIWFVATTYSFAAAIGFAAINKDATAAERQSQVELRATLATMKQNPRWQSSAACADATIKTSQEFCARYLAVESQLKVAPGEVNPQTALISRLTGYSQSVVDILLAVFLAAACEIISALGLYAIMPGREKSREKTQPSWRPPKWRSPGPSPAAASGRDNPRQAPSGPEWTRQVRTWKSPR